MNPTVELYDTNGVTARNDDWQTTQTGGMIVASQAAEIQTSAYAPKDPAESAILATLPPGSYTVIVRGVNATAGVAVLEVYRLP